MSTTVLLLLQVSQDVGYQVFATMATFYVPLIVILFLYWRIFVTARTRLRNRCDRRSRRQKKYFALSLYLLRKKA